MATSSIFSTPVFKSERAVESLLSALEASEQSAKKRKPNGLTVHEVRKPDDIVKLLGGSR